MKWILILMGWTYGAGTSGDNLSFTTAEFDDKAACELAIIRVEKLFETTHAGIGSPKKLGVVCVPKGSRPN